MRSQAGDSHVGEYPAGGTLHDGHLSRLGTLPEGVFLLVSVCGIGGEHVDFHAVSHLLPPDTGDAEDLLVSWISGRSTIGLVDTGPSGEYLLDDTGAGDTREWNELAEDLLGGRGHAEAGDETSERYSEDNGCESGSEVGWKSRQGSIPDLFMVNFGRVEVPVPTSSGVISIDLFALLKLTCEIAWVSYEPEADQTFGERLPALIP